MNDEKIAITVLKVAKSQKAFFNFFPSSKNKSKIRDEVRLFSIFSHNTKQKKKTYTFIRKQNRCVFFDILRTKKV